MFARFACRATGSNAKLPVTNSSPNKMIKMNPTGKIKAPTIGTLVCLVAVNARVVANPNSAPERKPRMRKSETESAALAAPASIMLLVTSVGLT
jgi:hypothetical protein